MALYHSDLGIVLGARDRGERDRAVIVLTQRFGLLELFAASARSMTSKLRPGLDPPCLSRVDFVRGRRDIAAGVDPVCRYPEVRRHLSRLRAVREVSAVLWALCPREHEEPGVWDAVLQMMGDLEQGARSPSACYYAALWRMLTVLGYAPSFAACGLCGTRASVSWVLQKEKKEGFACASCQNAPGAWQVSDRLRRALESFQKGERLSETGLVFSSGDAKVLEEASVCYGGGRLSFPPDF